ncbi:MAG: EAL domain-containing protein [Gammaproteobacteria bacterium]
MHNLSILINHLPIATLLCDTKGEIVAINEKACRLLNYKNQNILIDQLIDFSRSDIHSCECLADVVSVIRSRSDDHNAISIPYNNPPITHLSLCIQCYDSNGMEMICMVIRDISESKKLMDAFEYKENLLDNIITTSTDALIVFDNRGCIELFSPAAEVMFGRSSTEMIIEDIFCLFDKSSHIKIHKIIDQLKFSKGSDETLVFEDIRPINAHGKPFPSSITFSKSQKDRDSLFFMIISDKSLFHRFVNSVNDAYIKTDEQGHILDINNKTEELFNYDRNMLINKHISFLRLTNCNTSDVVADIGSLIDTSREDEDFVARNKRGDQLTLNLTVWPQEINNIRLNNLIIRDISQKKIAEQRLVTSAFTDSLTSISNRANFIQKLKKLVSSNTKSSQEFALIVLDLDKFKEVNDTYGHDSGDELLVAAANRLMSCVRSQDLVSRMGGDEFTIIIYNTVEKLVIDRVVERILRTFRRDFSIKGKRVAVSISIGIAFFPKDAQSADDIYKAADMAMYSTKRAGKDGYRYFTFSMYEHYERQKMIERALVHAVDNREFCIYFQPKISFSQSRLVGFEALLRWNHPELGFLSPDEFIPIAEDTGAIINITRWVLSQGMILMNRWMEESIAFQAHRPTLAVNISPDHFQYRLLDDIQACLKAHNYNPKLLEIEITESTLLNHSDEIINCLNRISDMGVHISMDDFGTGYSSLQYLKHFNLNTIKIDRSFVKDMKSESQNNFIIESIISIAKRLNLNLVAEGVESMDQLHHLVALGCDVFQGYYYSKPLPDDQVLAFTDNLDEHLKRLNKRVYHRRNG